jgi:lipopolysaccharide export system permease protein
VTKLPQRELDTTLSASRLMARVLTPERMSVGTLLDYIDYLNHNQLDASRQVVALWRKVAYPFTLFVMITIAAPISFMQTRRGGVGAKVFIGILLGVGFFMLNQLALNVGMLGRWPAWLTALGPNLGAVLIALGALTLMEYRHVTTRLVQTRWPWRKTPV